MSTLVRKTAITAACVAAMLGVFTWYDRPDFLLSLATQWWSCF
jgi:hypothetical protein